MLKLLPSSNLALPKFSPQISRLITVVGDPLLFQEITRHHLEVSIPKRRESRKRGEVWGVFKKEEIVGEMEIRSFP